MAIENIVTNFYSSVPIGGNVNDFAGGSVGQLSADLSGYATGAATGVSLDLGTALSSNSSGRAVSSPSTTLSTDINTRGSYFSLSSGVAGDLTFTVPASVTEVDVSVYVCTTFGGQTATDIDVNGNTATVDGTGNTTGTFSTFAGVVPNGSNEIVITLEDTDGSSGYFQFLNGVTLDNFVESSGVTGTTASTLAATTSSASGTVQGPAITGTVAETLASATSTASGTVEVITPTFTNDTFDGTGTLGAHWSVFDESAGGVTSVGRVSDYFEGTVSDNSSNRTRWFNAEEGRFDYQTVAVPASGTDTYIFRGVGVGPSTGDRLDDLSYSATPSPQFSFCGPMIKQLDDSMFAVAGHRGSSDQYTIEIKGTVSGTSTVTDEGADALGTGKTHGDFRVEVDSTGVAKFSYSELDADSWTYINTGNTGLVPAAFNLGSSGDEFDIGIIGYASDTTGVPFKFMVDSVELEADPTGTVVETLDPVTSSGSGTITGLAVTGTVASTLADATSAASGTIVNLAVTGTIVETLEDTTSRGRGGPPAESYQGNESMINLFRATTGLDTYNLNELAIAYYKQVGSTTSNNFNEALSAAQAAGNFIGLYPSDWRNS